MASAPRLLVARRELSPRRALVGRLGIAVGILLFIAALTWIGRSGYRDIDGSGITILDAVYYASVTATTTGYGDITPVSSAARAVTAFLVTPARILFLIVLVGTTIEVLTERFRDAVAESRWRRRVRDHVIVVGYGTKGRGAVQTLVANEISKEDIVVIDQHGDALAAARGDGLTAIAGDATRTEVLEEARVDLARAVIVACNRDDTATLVTLTARELNASARISASVRESENAHLLRESGAGTVIVSSEAAGRLLAMSTSAPRAVSVLEDLLVAGQGIDIIERPVAESEVGGPPTVTGLGVPVAVIRGDERLPFDHSAFGQLERDDVIVCITGGPAGGRPLG